MKQAREQQNHISALIHDGAVAEIASDLARELMLDALGGGVVPLEVLVTAGEVDVLFMEDRRPLERSSMLQLTGRAMAQFAR